MQVDRETLAKAYHKELCIAGKCEGDPDEADYHMADLANRILEDIDAAAVSL